MTMPESTENESKRQKPIVTPSVALGVLKAALDYVRDSGLRVRIGNQNGVCVMAIVGAEWQSDTQTLCVIGASDTQTTSDTQQGGDTP